MAIKRIVDTHFWNDDKVIDLFSPEDKLFMLYLLTNPHTTQLGVYPINKKHMAFELGYSIETISVLLDRFQNQYKIIKYSEKTKEIAIKNYLKHSIIKGGKPVEDCLLKEIAQVKDKSLLQFVYDHISNCDTLNDTVKKILDKLNVYENDNDNDNDNDVSYHDTGTNRERIVQNTSSKQKNDNKNIEQEFEVLWKMYPNKQGKPNALKAYKKARKNGVTFETIKQGLENYVKYCEENKTDKQYIKHGSTWFNQQCWDDEYTTTKTVRMSTDEIDELNKRIGVVL